ncbi:hypothetical protein BU26DRAFT_601199, partial [Trematosphaeria pertusa]
RHLSLSRRKPRSSSSLSPRRTPIDRSPSEPSESEKATLDGEQGLVASCSSVGLSSFPPTPHSRQPTHTSRLPIYILQTAHNHQYVGEPVLPARRPAVPAAKLRRSSTAVRRPATRPADVLRPAAGPADAVPAGPAAEAEEGPWVFGRL